MTRPGELAAAWRAAGFADVREALLTIRMEFADFADYWRPYLGGQGPGGVYVAALDPAARERLHDACPPRLSRRRARRPALLCLQRVGGQGDGARLTAPTSCTCQAACRPASALVGGG